MKTWDVAVVGLGAMGSATLYQLAKRGLQVVGIDQFSPPHDLGSSHGETRITRQAVGEGPAYVPLVMASHRIWGEVEEETGESLFVRSGALVMASASTPNSHHGKPDFVRRSLEVAEQYAIPHEVLGAHEIQIRFPQFAGLKGDEIGYFEPGGGYVRPEACISAQLRRARDLGAEMRTGTRVLGVVKEGQGIRIETDQGIVSCGSVVMASGAWIGRFMPERLRPAIVVQRQVLHWFELDRPELFSQSPVFIWMHGTREEDYLYGFPPMGDKSNIKVATEQYAREVLPERLDRRVDAAEQRDMFERHVRGKIAGASARPARSAVCMYTTTRDRGFIIDRHPDMAGMWLVSACSGHGFKHSAGIGEMVADQIASGLPQPVQEFRIARFHETAP